MGFACWWSCIGKGLRLPPAQQACFLFVKLSYHSKVNLVGQLEADKLAKAGILYVSIIGFPASRLLRYDKYVWLLIRKYPVLIPAPVPTCSVPPAHRPSFFEQWGGRAPLPAHHLPPDADSAGPSYVWHRGQHLTDTKPAVSHLNVVKRLVVERFLAPNLSRAFILEQQLCNRNMLNSYQI